MWKFTHAKKIAYPSGAYGNFLAYLLNYMMSGVRYHVSSMVYDHAKSHEYFFLKDHSIDDCSIYINVDKRSYLKFFITSSNRTSGIDLILEELHVDTFDKVRSHTVLKFFEKSLAEISNKSDGDVPVSHIREWLRLCFFADNCKTIDEYIGKKPKNCYIIEFDTFFSRESIKQTAEDILNHFGYTPATTDVDTVIDEFFAKQRYKNHIDMDYITTTIRTNQNTTLKLNLVEQAWLDNWLVETYNIDPVISNDYSTSTAELIKLYNLPVDKV